MKIGFSYSYFRRRFELLSAVVSIASLFAPLAPLPPELESYRFLLVTAGCLGLMWLVYFAVTNWPLRMQPRQLPDPPLVVLITGEERRGDVEKMCQSDELSVDEYIKFVPVCVAGDALAEADRTTIAKADGIIVFPDVTRADTPSVHKSLRQMARHRPLGIERFYPSDYTEPFETDFRMIPFRTPEHIVRYVSEFFFKTTTDTLLAWDGKLRRSARFNWVAGMFVLVASVLAWQSLTELRAVLRISETPSEVNDQVSRIYKEWGEQSKEPPSIARTQNEFSFLNDFVEIIHSEVTRILDNSEAKGVSVFAPTSDGNRLNTVVADGKSAYSVDPVDSIAGCAMRYNLSVVWEGSDGRTSRIHAWSADGKGIGTFNVPEQALQLPGGSVCRFDNRSRDGKSQLICVAIGAFGGVVAQGALCVALNRPSRYMARLWFSRYLQQMARPITFVDLRRLLQDFPILQTDRRLKLRLEMGQVVYTGTFHSRRIS